MLCNIIYAAKQLSVLSHLDIKPHGHLLGSVALLVPPRVQSGFVGSHVASVRNRHHVRPVRDDGLTETNLELFVVLALEYLMDRQVLFKHQVHHGRLAHVQVLGVQSDNANGARGQDRDSSLTTERGVVFVEIDNEPKLVRDRPRDGR